MQGAVRNAFAALFFSLLVASCGPRHKENPLLSLLLGTTPWAVPVFSYAGPGNQGTNMENLLVATIGTATSSIQCGFQDVNLGSVMNALQFAKSRGIVVRVGIDEDNRNMPGYRRLSGFLSTQGDDHEFWLGNSGSGQAYTNICVADKSRVFISTAPPTIQGFYSEPAFAMYFQDEETELPRKFQSEVDLLTHGSFGSNKQVLNRRNYYLLSDMEVGVYFAPKESAFEKFTVTRVKQARTSIQIFSSEFFSNELDGSSFREASDLAFETRFAAAPTKQVVVTTYAAQTADPDASGGVNSANYLASNGIGYKTMPGSWPDNGVNLILLDANTNSPSAYLSSYPFSARTDSSHDGFLLVFEYKPMVDSIIAFYNELSARSLSSISATGDDITTANQMEVVLSEINWMGSYDPSGSNSSSEYIELYNTTSRSINISGWVVQCGNGGAFATTVMTAPAQTVIGPGQFMVFAQSTSNPLAQYHYQVGGWGAIPNTVTDQCRLTDGAAGGNTVVDVAGVSGVAFTSIPARLGVNDSTNLVKRSMERTDLRASGANTTNWHSNSNSSYLQNLNFNSDRIDNTFGTPGYANSP